MMSNSRHTVKAALRDMRVHYKAYKVGKFWVYSAIVLATLAGGLGGTITAVSAATEPIAIQASATMDKTTTSQSSPDAQTAPQSTQADETTPVASTTSAATGEASGTSTSTPADLEKVASAASTPAVSSNLSASELTAKVTSTLMVSAQTLANATGDGPFTAGVNQVIPFEAFGGDGMLIRLLLTSAASAPWSDNGTGANAALSPVMGLASGQYFYEVDFGGNLTGKQGQALLDQLREDGTQTVSATLKVYAAGSDGQADTTNVVATKTGIRISFTGLTNQVSSAITVPAQYLANAKESGPFTAGVNQVIPYEAFGGDGMLTRLLLNSSVAAPWSDNGTAMNTALLPISGLATGQYFYEVDLAGNVAGKQGQALLDQLRLNGTQTYSATVKLYAAGADGQADTSKVIATKAGIQLNVEGLTSNIKNQINVPAAYLVAAKGDGPFTAGVNQVIPFEAFGGDGMLTRLLLSGSNLAAWSNNGTAMNKPILPISGLAKGEYAYSVVLGGNLAGKTGQALIDQLRKNGTQTYGATVTIYAIGSDGKAITTSPVATKAGVQITINVPEKAMTTPGQSKGDQSAAMSKPSGHGASTGKMAAMTAPAKSGMTTKTGSDTAMKPAMMQKAADKSSQMSSQMPSEKLLPQAGDAVNEGLTLFGTAMLALLAVVGTTVGINSKRRAG